MPYTDQQRRDHEQAMTEGEVMPVELVTFERKRSAGTLRIRRVSEAERNSSAKRFLLVCLGLASVMWIFPPHIVWVVGLVTTGIVGYFTRKKRGQFVLGGEAPCPDCGALQFVEKSREAFPLIHFCTDCHERCDISPAPASTTRS